MMRPLTWLAVCAALAVFWGAAISVAAPWLAALVVRVAS